MMKLRKIYILAAVAAVLASCNPWEPVEPPMFERVFFMYDNIGSRYFGDDVKEAGQAIAAGALDPNERVVVYERFPSGNVISELVKNSSVSAGFEKVERLRYAEGENSSLDAETIARVVGDARAMFSEDSGWGLAFGSHGSAWLPKTASLKASSRTLASDPFAPLWEVRERPLTRYLSSDKGEKLDIAEFVEAIGSWAWDFIILDDCFMASVESLYDMRSLCRYIIASPTEIMDSGFPYDRVVKTIFSSGDWTEGAVFEAVGQGYIDHYRTFKDYPYGTIAVIDMSQMEPLAATVRDIFRGSHREPSAETAAGFQTYEGLDTHVFYDFQQYIGYCSLEGPLYNLFTEQLARTVIYKGHTDEFPTAFPSGNHVSPMPIDPAHYSGLNCFVPTTATERLTGFWEQTAWYRYVYAE